MEKKINEIKKLTKFDSAELEGFISTVLKGVNANLNEKIRINSAIAFDIALTVSKEGGIKVSKIGGSVEKETVSRVKFSLNLIQGKKRIPGLD